ncbi:MAG: helicase-related protein, partial [Pirellulaceae bacterium]
MARFEDLKREACVRGISPSGLVTVVDTQWFGTDVVQLTYRDAAGRVQEELIFRDREPDLEIVSEGRPWTFNADGARFKLVSEAYRIHLAYLFDPVLAVHTSLVQPLPHQITAVYNEMLPRQPLRFLLADDPGSGKTIMAGLLIKELRARGDLQRCMIVCPGALVEQWQDELQEKFQLPFEILTNDKLESARTGNWFAENPLAVCRLDKLSRNEDLHDKIKQVDWDLIVVDEAHKMSASYFGGEVKYTKRHHLGQRLSEVCRHFLLMSATPHNGKEEDFQLFMSLLDGDRFEGKFRDGVHVVDTSDMMRRMVKEDLVKFDGRPLFPERFASTVNYTLSPEEADLYRKVTNYVRQEFNRADQLNNDGRRGTVGFALTILQRRLASSPEAIYQSVKRRRGRLEKRLREEKLLKRGAEVRLHPKADDPLFSEDDIDDFEDSPSAELEGTEQQILDQATAAQTIAELQLEIQTLGDLETAAHKVRQGGRDTKWEKLSSVLQDSRMFSAEGYRRKLVIFTEHRDTLNYLADKIGTLLGKPEAVVVIHGGIGREERRKSQEIFTQDADVQILVATDAAGEGINLQRAHLMVNYDLPWNPNRLEQRFGRIHRIGQTEVCHLWNIVASETREGDVFRRLFEKLEVEREALGGAVFDVLGKTIQGAELRSLLVEALRYGEREEVKRKLHEVVDRKFDREHLRQLIEERALAHDSMDSRDVQRIREEMERASARRLQPHFIGTFFLAAFRHLGGTIRKREPGRYEIRNVPANIRRRDRLIGTRESVLTKYERITFQKERVSVPGKPTAKFVCPGHPLLDATIDLVLERHRDLLKQGAILVDPQDMGDRIRVLFYLEHSIQDGRLNKDGSRRVISRRIQFVEINQDDEAMDRGYAPYLDYRCLQEGEQELVDSEVDLSWLGQDVEKSAMSYAVQKLVPNHLREIKANKEKQADRTLAAVKARLTKEITYWDHRAQQLEAQEQAGKTPKLNSAKARQRAEELANRLQQRQEELAQERRVSAAPPVVIGGALVIPQGLINRVSSDEPKVDQQEAIDRDRVDRLAVDAVMATERRLGRDPTEMPHQNPGYDIESRVPDEPGRLLFIEVKGKVKGRETVAASKTQILT